MTMGILEESTGVEGYWNTKTAEYSSCQEISIRKKLLFSRVQRLIERVEVVYWMDLNTLLVYHTWFICYTASNYVGGLVSFSLPTSKIVIWFWITV